MLSSLQRRVGQAAAGVYDQSSNAITIFTAIKSNQDYNINSKRGDEIVISIRDWY